MNENIFFGSTSNSLLMLRMKKVKMCSTTIHTIYFLKKLLLEVFRNQSKVKITKETACLILSLFFAKQNKYNFREKRSDELAGGQKAIIHMRCCKIFLGFFFFAISLRLMMKFYYFKTIYFRMAEGLNKILQIYFTDWSEKLFFFDC